MFLLYPRCSIYLRQNRNVNFYEASLIIFFFLLILLLADRHSTIWHIPYSVLSNRYTYINKSVLCVCAGCRSRTSRRRSPRWSWCTWARTTGCASARCTPSGRGAPCWRGGAGAPATTRAARPPAPVRHLPPASISAADARRCLLSYRPSHRSQ